MRKVLLVKGDGIGPEVTDAAVEVLNAVGFSAEYEEGFAGLDCFERTGEVVPEETLQKARDSDVVLFGAVTTPSNEINFKSAILTLRKELNLYANIRPFKTFPGIGRYGGEEVDIVLVRENTEGLYVQEGEIDEKKEVAFNKRIISRKATERIARIAAEKANGRITVTHKANVVKPSDVLFLEVASEVLKEKGVKFDSEIIDAMAMKLVKDPAGFDTILAPNFYGDVLSDMLAGVVGSIGLCTSANLGEEIALFEPVHGSAPDIAGKGMANPIGAILSGALMLEYLDEGEKAEKIRKAVEMVIVEGKTLTPDLDGNASTEQILKEIVSKLEV